MKMLFARMLGAVALLALLSWGAHAQQQTLVTPTATLNAQPQILCAVAAAVNTANACVTGTPGGTQSVYVTAVYFDVCTNAAGTAENNAAFQLTGAPGYASATNVWQYSVPSAGVDVCQHWGYSNGGGVLFKSLPGVAITITPPAAAAANSRGISVYGYIAQ